MYFLVAGLALLLALHSAPSVAPRWYLQKRLAWGPSTTSLAMTLGSLSAIALIVWGYGLTRLAPIVMYVPPAWGRYATDLLMIPVFPLAWATFLPCHIRNILRYPDLVAIALWAVAHLLANGMLSDLLLFSTAVAWAVINLISLRRRSRVVPSAAPSPYNDLVAIVAGLTTYLYIIAYLHYRLIGVSPI